MTRIFKDETAPNQTFGYQEFALLTVTGTGSCYAIFRVLRYCASILTTCYQRECKQR